MFGNFTTRGVEPCPVRQNRETSSIDAVERTKRGCSRIDMGQPVRDGICMLRTHGFGLRMKYLFRWLRLKLVSKRPYDLREPALASPGAGLRERAGRRG